MASLYAPHHDWYANCASKTTIQAHELIGSLTPCEDAQKGSENKAFIQVFHPIQSVKQSVKSNNKAMIHSHLTKQGASTLASLVCLWLGPSHRQAKHNEKTLEFMGSLTSCEDTKEM